MDYSKHMISFHEVLKKDMKFQNTKIKDMENELETIQDPQKYMKISKKLLLMKTFVNCECEFMGMDKAYLIPKNEFLETRCKLQLNNELIKHSIKETCKLRKKEDLTLDRELSE